MIIFIFMLFMVCTVMPMQQSSARPIGGPAKDNLLVFRFPSDNELPGAVDVQQHTEQQSARGETDVVEQASRHEVYKDSNISQEKEGSRCCCSCTSCWNGCLDAIISCLYKCRCEKNA